MNNRDTLKAYLRMMEEKEDWHAVWDAAIELYRIDAIEKAQEKAHS